MKEFGILDHEEMWRAMEVGASTRKYETFYNSGDFWLVKSSQVWIQARYGPPGGWIEEVVVGGPFLEGHTFRVTAYDTGLNSFVITWDDTRILRNFPSEFSGSGLLMAKYYDRAYTKAALRGHGDWADDLPMRSIQVDLPGGMKLSINMAYYDGLDLNFLDILISMYPQPGGQDGHCGKAAGDFEVNWWAHSVSGADSLLGPRGTMLLASSSRDAVVGRHKHQGARAVNASLANASENPAAECLGAGRPQDRVFCETVLNQTNDPWVIQFQDACAQDVCVAGEEAWQHMLVVAGQAFLKVAASAAGHTRCHFRNVPEADFLWDPSCAMGQLGCNADAKHVQCRFCGEGAYKNIPCH